MSNIVGENTIWEWISALIERNEILVFALLIGIAVFVFASWFRSRLLLQRLEVEAARFNATMDLDFDDQSSARDRQ